MAVAAQSQPLALDCDLAVEYLADALTREYGSIGNPRLDVLLDRLVALARSHAGTAVQTLAADPDDASTRQTARAMILRTVAVEPAFGRELELLLADIRPFGEDDPPMTIPARLGIVGDRVGPRLRADRIFDAYLEAFVDAPPAIKLCVLLGPLLWLGGFILIFVEGPWSDVELPFGLDLPIAVAWTGMGLCAIARWAFGHPRL